MRSHCEPVRVEMFSRVSTWAAWVVAGVSARPLFRR
jgi:hypothetical protein